MRDHRPAKFVRIFSAAMLLCSWLANPLTIAAHPMGNFSISHYAGIRIAPGFIELHYLIDMAEIPTFQEMQATGIVPKEGDPGLPPYLAKKADSLAAGLVLEVNGQPLPLQLISQDVIFPAGAGGLPTMKLGFVYRAALGNVSPGSAYKVQYRDNNFAGHAGWKEIVVTAESGSELTASSAPATDRSAQLSNYPTDLLSSPPQNLEATFTFTPSFSTAKNIAPVNGIHAPPAQPAVSAQANTRDGNYHLQESLAHKFRRSRPRKPPHPARLPQQNHSKPPTLAPPQQRYTRISKPHRAANSRNSSPHATSASGFCSPQR